MNSKELALCARLQRGQQQDGQLFAALDGLVAAPLVADQEVAHAPAAQEGRQQWQYLRTSVMQALAGHAKPIDFALVLAGVGSDVKCSNACTT